MGKLEIKARIQNKYNTLEYWENISRGFIPLAGEVCFATHNNNLLYQKIGDGKTDFQDLPWLTNQGDWDEQDENSPSYIKNRIAYKYPQDTQDTILSGTLPYSYIKFSTLPNINLLPEQYQNIDTLAFLDVSNIAISADQLTSQFSLYNLKLNNVTKKNININEIFEINEDAEAYLFGNNQFNDYLIQYLTNGTYYPDQQIVPHINLGSDYGFGTILLVEDNVITRVIASVISEEANITASGYYPAALIRIKKPGIKPIDPEFLGDLRADQHEINPKSTSYIKNNYGVVHTIDGFGEDSINAGETIFSGNYTLEPNIEVAGSYQARTNQIDTNYLEELYQALGEFALTTWIYEPQSFDPRVRFSSNIIINGETYKDCTHQILDLSILGGGLESNKLRLLMLGNPKLIYKALLGTLDLDLSEVGSQEYLYDNGMPFGLLLDSSGTLQGFASYKEFDNINLMLQLHHINLGFHQIPDAYITRNIQIGEWDGQSNGITFGNGYEASGINSIAMGLGAKAQGDESFAQGYYSIAEGKSSISLGENTEALGENSVALGKRAIANGLNSIAIGTNYIQKIENPQWLDNSTFIIDGQVSEEFTHIKYGEYWEEIESITYLPESDESQIKSKTERYRNSYTSTSISYNLIAEGENSIVLGTGNKAAKNNSIVLGQCNKDIENNQTIIGKFNNPSEGALVIGNGVNEDERSNAVEIDWEGNAKFNGYISSAGLKNKNDEIITGINSLENISYVWQLKEGTYKIVKNQILYFDTNEENFIDSDSLIFIEHKIQYNDLGQQTGIEYYWQIITVKNLSEEQITIYLGKTYFDSETGRYEANIINSVENNQLKTSDINNNTIKSEILYPSNLGMYNYINNYVNQTLKYKYSVDLTESYKNNMPILEIINSDIQEDTTKNLYYYETGFKILLATSNSNSLVVNKTVNSPFEITKPETGSNLQLKGNDKITDGILLVQDRELKFKDILTEYVDGQNIKSGNWFGRTSAGPYSITYSCGMRFYSESNVVLQTLKNNFNNYIQIASAFVLNYETSNYIEGALE